MIAKYVERLVVRAVNWADAGFEVFGTHVLWTDLVGNIAALATVLLAMRKSIWTWPVQFAGSVLLFIASVNAQHHRQRAQAGAVRGPGHLRLVGVAARHAGRQGARRPARPPGGSGCCWSRSCSSGTAWSGCCSTPPACRGGRTSRCPRARSWWPPTPTSSSAARSPPGRRAGRWSTSGSSGWPSTWSGCRWRSAPGWSSPAPSTGCSSCSSWSGSSNGCASTGRGRSGHVAVAS